MLANERVITIASSSPAGETSVTSARAASGLSARQVTAIVGRPVARIRSATVTASDVEPEREMMTTGSRPAPRVRTTSTPSGRRISSDSGAATTVRPRTGSRDCGDRLGEVVRRAGAGDDDPLRGRRAGPGCGRRPDAASSAAAMASPDVALSRQVSRSSKAVIGRAARRNSGSGRRGPCSGRTRSAGRPGRTRSARPGARAHRVADRGGPASSAVRRTGSNVSRARVGRQP